MRDYCKQFTLIISLYSFVNLLVDKISQLIYDLRMRRTKIKLLMGILFFSAIVGIILFQEKISFLKYDLENFLVIAPQILILIIIGLIVSFIVVKVGKSEVPNEEDMKEFERELDNERERDDEDPAFYGMVSMLQDIDPRNIGNPFYNNNEDD